MDSRVILELTRIALFHPRSIAAMAKHGIAGRYHSAGQWQCAVLPRSSYSAVFLIAFSKWPIDWQSAYCPCRTDI